VLGQWQDPQPDAGLRLLDRYLPGGVRRIPGLGTLAFMIELHGQRRQQLTHILADEVAGGAQPANTADRVRGAVSDGGVGIDPYQPVSHPRAGRRIAGGIHRELAVPQHLAQHVGDRQVGVLQSTGGTYPHAIGMTLDDCDALVVADDRDGPGVHRYTGAQIVVAGLHDLVAEISGGHHRVRLVADLLAHHIILKRGGTGRRADLGTGPEDVLVADVGKPQDQVGEARVSEQVPLARQRVEPFPVGLIEPAVGVHHLRQAPHALHHRRLPPSARHHIPPCGAGRRPPPWPAMGASRRSRRARWPADRRFGIRC